MAQYSLELFKIIQYIGARSSGARLHNRVTTDNDTYRTSKKLEGISLQVFTIRNDVSRDKYVEPHLRIKHYMALQLIYTFKFYVSILN